MANENMLRDNSTIPYISLFSGYEGIGLGLSRIFGKRLRTIAYCEREAFACANLVAKIEAGLLDAAPIFTDVNTFPWEQYAPFMADGILSFGFPCQPVSLAGKRKVAEDERWLFDICADGISILRPGFVFAENVTGLLSAIMPDSTPVIAHIFERLEGQGYRVEGCVSSAAECGAPHNRERVFIIGKLEHPELHGYAAAEEPRRIGTRIRTSDGPSESEQPAGSDCGDGGTEGVADVQRPERRQDNHGRPEQPAKEADRIAATGNPAPATRA